MENTRVYLEQETAMGRTKTPMEFITIYFVGGKYAVMGFGHSVPFSTEDKERV